MYSVELSREAQQCYAIAEKPVAKKLARCFVVFERDPCSGNNVKALKGNFAGAYRYRVGDLHVVFRIDDDAVIMFVITIAKLIDVYE